MFTSSNIHSSIGLLLQLQLKTAHEQMIDYYQMKQDKLLFCVVSGMENG